MELWEFNACVNSYNASKAAEDRLGFIRTWETAALTGQAMAGKLKKLSSYTKDAEVSGQTLTLEQMNEFDRKLEAQSERRLEK